MTWTLEGYPEVHLRAHLVQPSGAQVALAKGKDPGGGTDPWELEWIVQEVTGALPLATQFVTVLEAYEGNPLITEIRRLEVSTEDEGDQPPLAFEVVSGDRVDTIIHSDGLSTPVTTSNGITMRGTFGVLSQTNGKTKGVFLANGTVITKGGETYAAPAPSWTGKIASADCGSHRVVVATKHDDPQQLVGRYARITNVAGHNDVTHLITAARRVGVGTELTFELDPRIGEGRVAEIHEAALSSATRLHFAGRTYYLGKVLANADASARYRLCGVRSGRVYINTECHRGLSQDKLRRSFTPREGRDAASFYIYDYGPGDTVTVPSVISVWK